MLLPIIVTFLIRSPISLSCTNAGDISFNQTLKPVGHHSTNAHFSLFCNHCTAVFASFDFTSPR